MATEHSENVVEGLVTAQVVAGHFSVTSRTVLYWATEKKIPVAVRAGRVVRFRLSDVIRALEGGN